MEGLDPEVGVGRSEENPIWDWKSLGSRDIAGRARRAVAGEEGEELRAQCRLPARAPAVLGASARPGFSSGWVRGALGRGSCPGPDPGDRALAAVEEIMEGVSRVCLFFASLFTIWRPAFKLYFYSQRHFGCIYNLQTFTGEQ